MIVTTLLKIDKIIENSHDYHYINENRQETKKWMNGEKDIHTI